VSGWIGIGCQPVRAEAARAETQRLIAYWQARCSGRLIPARADLDVLDLGPWLGGLSLYEALPDGDFRCRLRGSTMTTVPVPNHAADGILVSVTRPRNFAQMGLEHYAAAQAAGAPAIQHIELAWKGFSYDYERLTLPLAEGSGLPPMVLTLITCSIPKSREFWERYAEG
jgi:hypothetical protein